MSRVTRSLMLLAFLLVVASVGILALRFPGLAMMIVGGRSIIAMRKWRGSGGYSHGTARAATVFDMLKAGFLPGDDGGKSLIVGNSSYSDPPTLFQAFRVLLSPSVPSTTACRMMIAAMWGQYETGMVRINDFTHLLTVAPAGAGKSVSVIIMNLMSYAGACVITDPAGELWKATAWFRQTVMKRRCYRIDPFGMAGPSAEATRLNPLDFVDPNGPDFADQVRDIADAIVLRDDKEQPHFNDKAVDFIAGMIAFVCACEHDPAKRNLGVVRDILSSRGSYLEAIKQMQETTGFHGVLQYYGHQLTWVFDRELGSVVSTVFRHLSWLSSPIVMDSLSCSTFDPRWLWATDVDLYIITPHDRLTTLAGLLRLQLSTVIRMLARHGDEKHKVLFMLDEIGHCGRMPLVEDAITLWRKSGLRMWLFVQSLDQLRKVYGDRSETVIDNCGTQQYFGISSYDTAEVLSKRVGDFTLILESVGRNASRSKSDCSTGPDGTPGNISTGWNTTLSEAARRLYKPEEILRLPSDLSLVFHRNFPVLPLRLDKFFRIPNYKKHGTGRENPPGFIAAAMACAAMLLGVLTVQFVAMVDPPTIRYADAYRPSSPSLPAYGVPAGGGDVYGNAYRPMTERRQRQQRYRPQSSPMGGDLYRPYYFP